MIELAQLNETYLDCFVQYLADPEGRRLTGTHATFTREQAAEWLRTRPGAPGRRDWAIVEDGAFLGEVVLNDIDPDNRCANLRIGLRGPDVYGRGYGTAAVRMALERAWGELGLHRVELEVYAFNPRAQRVYEKCGFVVEGRRRDALLWDGEWVDAIGMAVLAPQPE